MYNPVRIPSKTSQIHPNIILKYRPKIPPHISQNLPKTSLNFRKCQVFYPGVVVYNANVQILPSYFIVSQRCTAILGVYIAYMHEIVSMFAPLHICRSALWHLGYECANPCPRFHSS